MEKTIAGTSFICAHLLTPRKQGGMELTRAHAALFRGEGRKLNTQNLACRLTSAYISNVFLDSLGLRLDTDTVKV